MKMQQKIMSLSIATVRSVMSLFIRVCTFLLVYNGKTWRRYDDLCIMKISFNLYQNVMGSQHCRRRKTHGTVIVVLHYHQMQYVAFCALIKMELFEK
ncbi:hypothetical protein RhiirA4_13523 [Rhizophagus irregularis]|uniref:Uncharacterized protein n=1 Tax=Rhizophagus irregularis TaxID=588596 RepID=A0A2I1G1X2_9GLOM|nr:hypothetical protein RhiirA4_13523 [Rhizophagus irregularis]